MNNSTTSDLSWERMLSEKNKEVDTLQKKLDIALQAMEHISKHPLNYGYEVREHWANRIVSEAIAKIDEIK